MVPHVEFEVGSQWFFFLSENVLYIVSIRYMHMYGTIHLCAYKWTPENLECFPLILFTLLP